MPLRRTKRVESAGRGNAPLIPSFNSAGIIPPYLDEPGSGERSPYPSNIIEFVQRFATSPERRQILRGLLDYRAILYGGGFTEGYQLLNGSFVEDCEAIRGRPPKDIDVFSCLSLPQRYIDDLVSRNNEAVPFLVRECTGREVKERCKVDAYLVVNPPGMSWSEFFHIFCHFTLLFSHQRGTELWKGAVSVPLDPPVDDAARQLLNDLDAR